jgi:U3 small nucleolar RNA-associated protein 7
MAVDKTGHYMVTGGADSQIKVWDLRMYKETHSYYTRGGPSTSIDISQRGILGIGHGSHATFWSPDALKYKMKDPYMSHNLPGRGPVESLRFRPFEDVCGIGHAKGFSSIVIPGCGEPNLDSMEYNTNPYHDNKQRREGEVRALLDKLSPDMIALDPDVIGTVEVSDPYLRLEKTRELEEEANARKQSEPKPKEKKKMRGRSKIGKKLKRKQKNVIDENLVKLKEARETEKAAKKLRVTPNEDSKLNENDVPLALKRFYR